MTLDLTVTVTVHRKNEYDTTYLVLGTFGFGLTMAALGQLQVTSDAQPLHRDTRRKTGKTTPPNPQPRHGEHVGFNPEQLPKTWLVRDIKVGK